MSAHALHAAPPEPGPAGPHGHREVLDDLIALGANFARLLHAQAQAQSQAAEQAAAPAPPAPAPEALTSLAAAFDQVARAVRRCILLARSLGAPAPLAPDPLAPGPARRRAAARRRIIREVEDAIARATAGTGTSDGAETLHAELRERLDAPDLDDDIHGRPVADVIADICRDLGLAAPRGAQAWPRRTPDDIRQLCARAAAPSGAGQPGGSQRPSGQPPAEPAVTPAAQPGPVQHGSSPPNHPAELIATILHRPAHSHGPRRPPPDG